MGIYRPPPVRRMRSKWSEATGQGQSRGTARTRAAGRRPARRHERGAALIIAVVLVVLLTLIGATLIQRNSDTIDAAGAKKKYDVAVTCADGARQLLLSQFRTYGTNPTSIVIDQTIGDKRYTTGHYDTFALSTVATSSSSAGRTVGVSDATNRSTGPHLGGTVYRMTVVCTDTSQSSHQSEVEFLVRFGL